MKNITAIILALLLAANAAAAQTKRALCIGIGSYMDKTWPEIHGDKDIEDLIVPMLSKNGFSSENIKVLLNERATSKNIKDAFNALLKILEEPPEHLMFILATTELHKVLPTILSRCQRFSFKRILPRDMEQQLLH
mgnify:CR=1 FL=1